MRKFVIVVSLLLSSSVSFAQFLQKNEALEDLNEFKALMETESSYYQLSDFDFEARYQQIENKILPQDSIPIHFLAYEMEKIIGETIDRHASLRMEAFDEKEYETLGLHFPFVLSSLDGKVVALKEKKSKGEYEYYSKKYPYLKSINGLGMEEFIEHYAYRRKNSPKPAMLTDGLKDLRNIGELYFKQGNEGVKELDLVLTDGKRDKKLTLPLSEKRHSWVDLSSLRANEEMRSFYGDKDFDLTKLDKWLTDSIAYLAIPAMASYKHNSNIEPYLKATMQKYSDAKALVIDLRSNGGGTRDILNTLSDYLVQPEESPWVANVAYVRSDQRLDEDISSMQGRYLYNYNSDTLSDEDRKAIDAFNDGFETSLSFDETKFSHPFYMVLHSKEKPFTQSVYILVNEESFSAASVFTTALKGLSNVKIVGVTTNGSSGRSVYFNLKHSNINIRLSTMLSFQRNGKTLDGNGTEPDIVIERREEQIFGKKDTQLEDLVEWILTN
ncbi:MAG TPA: S41 family peptidase [Flavobacteriaceae bacterium]|nr:S41 family peptidase [Flavobacteriaceae bacterium]